ncbi:MAG: hypothetical protein ACREPE_10165, partial [Lysobacter sp.]
GQARHAQDWAEFAAARNNHGALVNRMPKVPAIGLYMLRAAPHGGRAENVLLIEALPSPRDALGLEGVARRFESKAYRLETAENRRYGFMPITVSDWRYALEAKAD